MDQQSPKALSLKQIFTVSMTLYIRNIKRFLLISFTVGFPMVILDMFTLQTRDNLAVEDYQITLYIVLLMVNAFVVIFFPFIFIALSHETYNNLLKNQATIEKSLNDAFKRMPLVTGTGLFVYSGLLLFSILVMPLGSIIHHLFIYFINIFLALYPFVIAFEDYNPIDVIRRSFWLAWVNFPRLFVIMLLVNLISPLNLWHLDILPYFQYNRDFTAIAVYSVVETVMLPLQCLLMLIFYFDLRRQTENFNIKMK